MRNKAGANGVDQHFALEDEAVAAVVTGRQARQQVCGVEPEARLGVVERPAGRPGNPEIRHPVAEASPLWHALAREQTRSDDEASPIGGGCFDEAGDRVGRVLTITIHRDNRRDAALECSLDAGPQACRLAAVVAVADDGDRQSGEPVGGAVARAVVDDDHRRAMAERVGDNRTDRRSLVECGNDDGDAHRIHAHPLSDPQAMNPLTPMICPEM